MAGEGSIFGGRLGGGLYSCQATCGHAGVSCLPSEGHQP